MQDIEAFTQGQILRHLFRPDGRGDQPPECHRRDPGPAGCIDQARGSNLINAQAWSGEITWDLLLGTNTLRNLHFNVPLSVSLQNDNFTLSLACDSYSVAEADAAVAAAIATALAPFKTAAQRDAAIAAALTAYSTTAQMDAAIAAAVAAIDLSPYYTSAQTDVAITAALVPVTPANAPAWGANPPTWELLKGTNVLRNLHFAGPLSASLQNNTDTLEIDCDSYEKVETYTQAEVNSLVSGAVDALNIGQYQTSAQVYGHFGGAGALLYGRGGGHGHRGPEWTSAIITPEPRATPGISRPTRTPAIPKCSPWSATAFPSRGKSGASYPGRRWPGATSSPARLLQGGGGRALPELHGLHRHLERAVPGHQRDHRQRGDFSSGGVPDPVVTGAARGSGTALTLRAGSTNVRIEAQNTTTPGQLRPCRKLPGRHPAA